MARIVIHRITARRESEQQAFQFTRKILREIQFRARTNLFTGPYTTGRLAASIDVDGPYMGAGRVHGSVGSDKPYAAAVEGGAGLYGPRRSKYLIRPRRKARLQFYWRRMGRFVKLPYVHHPGQKGKGYLREAAEVVGRRYNMIVIFYDV